MCGRFAVATPLNTLIGHFEPHFPVRFDSELEMCWRPRYNIAPTQDAPAIRFLDGSGHLGLLRFGLVPHWADEPRTEYSLINARAETVASKPAFRAAFHRRRCLIPATGFYEWQVTRQGKQPWYVHVRDSELFAMAGLWEHWEGEAGVIESFAIIVTEANDRIRHIHDRMPVIIAPENYGYWIDPDNRDSEGLQRLLRPWPGEKMVAWPVSRRVNRPDNDGPELLRPLHLNG